MRTLNSFSCFTIATPIICLSLMLQVISTEASIYVGDITDLPPIISQIPCNPNPGQQPGQDPSASASKSANNSANETSCSSCSGMPTWWVSEPFINLRLEDEPLGYQPSRGPRILFHLSYRQRGAMTEDPAIFSVGINWSSTFRAYVFSPDSTNYFLQKGGAGVVPYTTGIPQRWDGSLLNAIGGGWQIINADGSFDTYTTQSTNSDGLVCYFMTTQADAAGNTNSYTYHFTSSGVLQLASLTDADGNTTRLSYDNVDYPNLITKVADPFNRTNYLNYSRSGYLTNSIDVAGLSSFFVYDAGTPGWITNLITPYGATGFSFGGVDVNAPLGDAGVNRYARVTLPTGGKHLYLYMNNCSFLNSWTPTVPNTSPLANTFEAFSDGSYPYFNSFYWGPLQYGTLSTTNPSSFTATDYANGRLRHWLLTDDGSAWPSSALSIERAPSPGGATAGQLTWYDYENKYQGYHYNVGASTFPSFKAKVLPDASTQFTYSLRGKHLNVTNLISTYTALSNSVAFRTNSYIYATNAIDLIKSIGPNGEQVISNYFASGNAIHRPNASYDALNQVSLFTYNGYGQITSIKNQAGLTTTNTYFTSGASINRLSKTVDLEISRTNSFTFYTNGLVATHTDERGMTTTSYWDNLQRLTGMNYPDGTSISNRYTSLDITAKKDRLGNWNYFGYNSIRQKIIETNVNNVVTGYNYCDCGLLYAVTNGWNTTAQMVTSYGYDNQGNRSYTYLPDSTITNYYDALGRVTTNSDTWGSEWFAYNNQGRRIAVNNAYGTEKLVNFDIEDRPVYMVDANQVAITNAYDLLGRLTWRSYPDGGVEQFGYSARGLIAHTNQLSMTDFYGYDVGGRRTFETNANSEIIIYSNNAAGDLLSLTDGKSQTTRWNYDEYGRVTNKLDQTGVVILSYQYDANNRLTNRWSLENGNTVYSYDAVDNLTFIDYPNSPDVTLQYDALNRLTNMVDAVGITKFSYAPGGELYTEDGPFVSDTVTNFYSGRLRTGLKLQQPTGIWTNGFGYDSARRLTSVSSSAGAFGNTYDSTRLKLPVNLSLPNSSYITNRYDGNARLFSTKLVTSGGTVLDSSDYGYNAGNQRTTFTNAAGTILSYLYDPVGQLKVADSSNNTEDRGYLYDAAWNLSRRTNGPSATFTVDGNNQLTAVGANHYAFDGNGNLTNESIFHSSTITYAYDDENRLISAHSSLPGKLTTFVYDGLGRLREQLQWQAIEQGGGGDEARAGQQGAGTKLTSDVSSGSWTLINAINYIYDGNRVIQERDSNNIPTVAYTRGNDLSGTLEGSGGIGGLLARSESYSSGSFTSHAFYHADGNGNITSLVDGSQVLAASYRYDAFGNLLSSSGSLANDNTYRFSSKEWMPDISGYYYLYRFYRPDLQRWINRDPIQESGGVNLYEFVKNNPVVKIDPTGKLGVWFCSSGEWSACFDKCQRDNGPDWICSNCIVFYQRIGVPPFWGAIVRLPVCVCSRVDCTPRK